ncbi:MAG: AsmA family protein, partial [Alphaproteobacteria bacterium]
VGRKGRIGFIIGGMLAFFLLLAVAVPFFVDVERFKPRILAAISEAAGRQVAVDGRLSLSLLPRPRLSVQGLRIANAPGFSSAPMVAVKRLDVEVALWPLLRGDLAIERLVLRQPDILLERAADGANNWTFAAADSPDSPPSSAPQEQAATVSIARMRLADGRLAYVDHGTGRRIAAEDIDAGLGMGGMAGPFDIEARARVQGLDIAVAARIGRLDDGPASVEAQGGLGDDALTWRFGGSYERAGKALRGAFEARAADMARLADRLARAADAPPPRLPARALSLTTHIATTEDGLRLSDLALRLGNSTVAGLLSLDHGARTHVRAQLEAARLDLADWADWRAADPDAPGLVGPFALTLPADFTADVRLAAARLDGVGAPVSNALVVLRLADGRLDVAQAQAQLPGGDAALTGTLASVDGHAAFEGALRLAVADMRALLVAAGVPDRDLPERAYRRAALAGTLRLAGDRLALDGIDARLDDSGVSGRLAWHLRVRPAYDGQLSIDRLNLARYWPAAPAGARDAATVATVSQSPLAGLDGIDADIGLTVVRLERGQHVLGDAAVQLSLLQGVLTIEQARIGDPAQARINISGTARSLADMPKFDLRLDAQGAGAAHVYALLGQEAPPALANGGPLRLAGTAAGTLASMAVDLTGSLGALDAAIKGRLDGLDGPA